MVNSSNLREKCYELSDSFNRTSFFVKFCLIEMFLAFLSPWFSDELSQQVNRNESTWDGEIQFTTLESWCNWYFFMPKVHQVLIDIQLRVMQAWVQIYFTDTDTHIYIFQIKIQVHIYIYFSDTNADTCGIFFWYMYRYSANIFSDTDTAPFFSDTETDTYLFLQMQIHFWGIELKV